MAGWQPGCESLNGRNLELWLPILAIAALVEDAGLQGLVAEVEQHAIKSMESAHESAMPEIDELLLRTLKQMQEDRSWGVTAGEVLRAAKEIESAVLCKIAAGGTCSMQTADELWKYLGLKLKPCGKRERQ